MDYLLRWALWVAQYVVAPFWDADPRSEARRLTLGCALVVFAIGAALLLAFQ